MKVNTDKTALILATTHQKRGFLHGQTLNLNIDGEQIESEPTAKLLGVVLGHNFTYRDHVDELIGKLRMKLNGIRKVRPSLTMTQAKRIMEASITSRLLYGMEVLSCGSHREMEVLSLVHSQAARIILKR